MDACPKDKQRYSATSRDVREVAYLIGRTPAAVSRAFANIWAALTDGREGLANNSALCRAIVAEYRGDSQRLHSDAIKARDGFLAESLAPRLEVRSERSTGLLETDLNHASLRVSRETGVPRSLFAVYRHEGSVIEGAVLVSGIIGSLVGSFAQPVAERFVRWVESRLQQDEVRDGVRILRTRTWEALRDGNVVELERTVISRYLPDLRAESSLDARSRHALAWYLAAVLGVGRTEAAANRSRGGRVSGHRRQEIETRLGVNLSRVPQSALRELDALVRVVDTKGFRKAVKQLQQTRLEDFEGGPN